MSDLYALCDKAGVVRRVIYAAISFDGLTPYPLPAGYWLGDVRLSDGTWQHPVVPTSPPVPSDADRIAALETRVDGLDGGGV